MKDALLCGGHLVIATMKWLRGSWQVTGTLGTWLAWPFSIVKDFERDQVVALLERFRANPSQTRHALRVKLGVLDEMAAKIFALTVFLCDDLLQLKPAPLPATHSAAVRFFAITSQTAHGAADDLVP